MSGRRNIGVMAHVDTGKTTLTEHLLYRTGAIRSRGSVDEGTAYSDRMAVERERGISVEATCVAMTWRDTAIHLIDTPGHADFAAQVERSLWALDGAVLMVSAVDGLKPYGELLWEALEAGHMPRLIFINQCDRPTADPEGVLEALKRRLGTTLAPVPPNFTDCGPNDALPEPLLEALADLDDTLAERYLAGEIVTRSQAEPLLAQAVGGCRLTPVLQGSAARDQGLETLLDAMVDWLPPPEPAGETLCGVIFGVESDRQLGRAAHVRLFSGRLAPRDALEFKGNAAKITAIRTLQPVGRKDMPAMAAGDVAVVYGLPDCRAGDILGDASQLPRDLTPGKLMEPLLMSQVIPAGEQDMPALRRAMDEICAADPLMRVHWSSLTRQLTCDVMGAIQLEILGALLRDRFGLEASFGPPKVVYKETVAAPGEGIAVYTMPKPCWAILKFRVEPLPLGSGVQYACIASSARLPYRYRRQVEQTIPRALRQGMLGWEVTDVKLTLVDGEDHPIHTHPLDFVLATPWAVMEALKDAGSQLLEPMLRCRITVPQALGGRVMNEVLLMRGEYEAPQTDGEMTTVTARLPVSETLELPRKLAAMTGGRAVVTSRFDGYRPCPLEKGETCPRRSVSPLDRAKYILAMRNALEGGLRDE